MSRIRLLPAVAFFAIGWFVLAAHAFAQTVAEKSDSVVSIPVSSWVEGIGAAVLPMVALFVAWIIRKLPSQVAAILTTMRVDQLLEKAISYGINTTVNATKDKPLTVDLGNEVVAKAAQYVVDNGPGWLIGWMGGAKGIEEKIIARINVDSKAAVTPQL
jgi:hypothetical protein